MNNQERDILQDIVREKLADFEMPTSLDQWQKLDSALDNRHFWTFSIKSFNGYYATMIVLAFVFSGLSFFNSIQYSFDLPKSEAEVADTVSTTIVDTLKREVIIESDEEASETIQETKPLEETAKTFQTSKNKEEKHVEQKAALKPIQNAPLDVEKDSIKVENSVKLLPKPIPLPIKDTVPKKDILVKKPKKVVYLSKRDTIFKADTIRKVRRK